MCGTGDSCVSHGCPVSAPIRASYGGIVWHGFEKGGCIGGTLCVTHGSPAGSFLVAVYLWGGSGVELPLRWIKCSTCQMHQKRRRTRGARTCMQGGSVLHPGKLGRGWSEGWEAAQQAASRTRTSFVRASPRLMCTSRFWPPSGGTPASLPDPPLLASLQLAAEVWRERDRC